MRLQISQDIRSNFKNEYTGLFTKNKSTDNGLLCEIGTLRFGQSIDLVFELNQEFEEPITEDQIKISYLSNHLSFEAKFPSENISQINSMVVQADIFRFNTIEFLDSVDKEIVQIIINNG